jgi:putative transposase
MPEYRRAQTLGGTFFFTVVTYRRQPLLTHPASQKMLHNAAIPALRRAALIMQVDGERKNRRPTTTRNSS